VVSTARNRALARKLWPGGTLVHTALVRPYGLATRLSRRQVALIGEGLRVPEWLPVPGEVSQVVQKPESGSGSQVEDGRSLRCFGKAVKARLRCFQVVLGSYAGTKGMTSISAQKGDELARGGAMSLLWPVPWEHGEDAGKIEPTGRSVLFCWLSGNEPKGFVLGF